MARLRSPAQRAPQTREEALPLATRFAALDARESAIEARRARLLARVNAAAEGLLVLIVAEKKDIVKQLKPWWAGNVDALTEGKRKSIEFGGCLIGYRINPPKVDFAPGGEDAAVAALVAAQQGDLVRTKLSPDKVAILRVLDAGIAAQLPAKDAIGQDELDRRAAAIAAAEALTAIGFARKQPELFFVDRLGPKPDTVADVTDPDAGSAC